jgi:hypothetical protein
MPDKKTLTRTFETELRTLPVELVPPDPAGLKRPNPVPQANPAGSVSAERGVVDRLINRIKRI